MKKLPDRRSFLQAAGAATAGLGLRPRFRAASENSDGVPRARLLVGCCAYSYAKYLKTGEMSMEDFIRKAVELRLQGVDITVYWLKSTEPVYLATLRHLAFKNGMPFSGAACGASMVQADKAKRTQVLDDIKKWIEVTDQLGASHLRIFAGKLPAGDRLVQGIAWSVELMKAACDFASTRGITLGLEDHSGITQSADTILEIIRQVDSPYAGINLDITNFVPSPTADQYAQIEACIPYATHTHIRERFSSSGKPVDLDRVWKLFANGGYKGYMSAEYEGNEEAATAVPKLIARIRNLCQKYSAAA